MAADACSDHGLTLASFEKETIDKLKGYLPAAANCYNPVDVLGDASADRYEFAIKTVMEDPNVSCVAVLLAPWTPWTSLRWPATWLPSPGKWTSLLWVRSSEAPRRTKASRCCRMRRSLLRLP